MTFIYSDPERETDPHSMPDVEVFHIADADISNWADQMNISEEDAIGWYYWYCFLGCLPDSDPVGPYDTEAEAIEAVRDEWECLME